MPLFLAEGTSLFAYRRYEFCPYISTIVVIYYNKFSTIVGGM